MNPETESTHPRSTQPRGLAGGTDQPAPAPHRRTAGMPQAPDRAFSNRHEPSGFPTLRQRPNTAHHEPKGPTRNGGKAARTSTQPRRRTTPHRPQQDGTPTLVPASSASPQPPVHNGPGGNNATTGTRHHLAQQAADPTQLLFTPAQAAAVLQVRESWLRRRAARRQVPCVLIGKHLRFSRADLEQIAAAAARPAETTRPTGSGPGPYPRRPSRARGRTGTRRPDA